MKTVLRAVALVLLSAALGTALLVGAYALPKDAMCAHVADSVELLAYENGYPRVIEGWHVSMLDNYTDTVMLLTAIGGNAGESLAALAMNAPRPALWGGNWLIGHIDTLADNGMPQDVQQTIYPRYWHGYLILLKPLLLAFDYPQIRIVNMLVQGFLLLAVMALVLRRVGRGCAVALTAAILCLTPVTLPLSMQFSACYYMMLLALLFLLSWRERLQERGNGLLFFCAVGILTNYFDLLTYPIITLGIPLAVYLLTQKDATVLSSLGTAAACSLFWGFGYAAMWTLKWTIATALTGSNVFADAISAIGERTSLMGGGELGAGEITRLSTIRALVAMLKRRPYLLMAAGIVLGCVWLVLRKRATIGVTRACVHVPSWLCIALMPFAWYAVMPNHSYTHYFFTFRALAVTVFALLCCVFSFLSARPIADTSPGAPACGAK